MPTGCMPNLLDWCCKVILMQCFLDQLLLLLFIIQSLLDRLLVLVHCVLGGGLLTFVQYFLGRLLVIWVHHFLFWHMVFLVLNFLGWLLWISAVMLWIHTEDWLLGRGLLLLGRGLLLVLHQMTEGLVKINYQLLLLPGYACLSLGHQLPRVRTPHCLTLRLWLLPHMLGLSLHDRPVVVMDTGSGGGRLSRPWMSWEWSGSGLAWRSWPGPLVATWSLSTRSLWLGLLVVLLPVLLLLRWLPQEIF